MGIGDWWEGGGWGWGLYYLPNFCNIKTKSEFKSETEVEVEGWVEGAGWVGKEW